MNILILGSGGREHSLAWAIKQNPKCDRLIVAPGNAGIAEIAWCADLDILDGDAVVSFAAENTVDFVIVGPEAPLAVGIADRLRDAGFLVFGPSQAAAQLEASKAFTKEICDAANAPTAGYAHFADLTAAKAYVAKEGAPIVIKADGLAAGKGVTVAMTEAEALAALDDMFDGNTDAEVVIEEFMEGEEASFFVLSDGETLLPVGTAQDHKRVGDGDTGPNTGGMGVEPTMAERANRGTPFEGVLFVGLMIKNGQPRLVEFNVRFGDPECQCLMMRLGGQILDLLLACAERRLSEAQVNWADDHALTVVLAAEGYPGAYKKGSVINGLANLPTDSHHMTFHAGTGTKDGATIATGGRVLAATGRADTLKEAKSRAYAQANAIDWPEGFFRTDIGWRAL